MKKSSRLPNVVCVGAPKCGTTTIYDYLRQHPSIFLPKQKELHFFSNKDLYHLNKGPQSKYSKADWVRTFDEYTHLFSPAEPHQICGDISPSYLYALTAPQQIAETLEDPKIIICLRHPVDRAYSQYMHLIREARETKSFLHTLELENERITLGWDAIFHCKSMSLYSDAVERYIATFGNKRIFIVWFDELIKDVESMMSNICDFLDIDTSFKFTPIQNRNISGRPKSRLLASIAGSNPISNTAKKFIPRDFGRAVKSAIFRINIDRSIKITREERNSAFSYFQEDVKNLEKLLGVNTGWMDKNTIFNHNIFDSIHEKSQG